MKTLPKYLLLCLVSTISLGQTHVIHDNTTSVTILPTSIQSNHVANQTLIKNNLVLGNNAMSTTVNNANNNIAIGFESMKNPFDGNYNVAVGHNANYWSIYSDKNVAIGYNALKAHSPIDGSGVNNDDNVAVGFEALKNTFCLQNRNVAVGSQAFLGGAYNSVGIGYQAGFNSSFQTANIFLGHQAGYSEATSNKLYIENSNSTTPLIGGDFANDIVGINMPVGTLAVFPNDKLQVGGSARISGNLFINGSILTNTTPYTGNIVLTSGHYRLIYSGSGGNTITLPNPLMQTGREYQIINHGQGSLQTIPYTFKTGFSTTDQYLLPGNVLHLVSDGTDWHKVN